MARSKGKTENKMTIYLDKRSEEVDESELTEEQQKEMQRTVAAAFLANLLWRIVVTPVVFFLLWNMILSPTFGISKIGYFKSLGMLVMASIVLGNVKLEKDS